MGFHWMSLSTLSSSYQGEQIYYKDETRVWCFCSWIGQAMASLNMLNMCVEKDVHLIESIPFVLLRFRQNAFGVLFDIQKAFLQINLHSNDRSFLKFWWVDATDYIIVYRHNRITFGISSIRFVLIATIAYHLAECLKKWQPGKASYSFGPVRRLSKALYVDNGVTSLVEESKMFQFVQEAKANLV